MLGMSKNPSWISEFEQRVPMFEGHSWQPILLQPALDEDWQSIQQLRAEPSLTVFDTLLEQLEEWVETSLPSRTLNHQQKQALVKETLGETKPEQYGVWVYYPWKRYLVHLLPKEHFIRVRTDRNRNKITASEQETLLTKKVGVIGLSVGQSVSLVMSMERICGTLRLADFDHLSLSNLNRLRAPVHSIGLPKTIVVAREIAELDPFLSVEIFPEGVNASNLDVFLTGKDGNAKLDLLVEESDGFDAKIRARMRAKAFGIPVLMEASDRCMLDIERFDKEPTRPLLHGLLEGIDPDSLASLGSTEEKIPIMLKVLGIEQASVRLKASMLEIGQSVSTWPQLASAVAMGGGVAADIARRILLDHHQESGRFYIDLDAMFAAPSSPIVDDSEMELRSWDWCWSQVDRNALPPAESPTLDEVNQMMEAARWAPSGGNAQPWRFCFFKGKLWMFDGADCRNTLLGYGQYPHHVALGASWTNLSQMAAHLGWDAVLENLSLKNIPALVATITFSRRSSVSAKPLNVGKPFRQTDRRHAPVLPVPHEVLQALTSQQEGLTSVSANFVEPGERLHALTEIIATSEKIRLLDPKGGLDFIKEVRWTLEEANKGDGIDIETIEATAKERAGFELFRQLPVQEALRKWKGGGAFQTYTRNYLRASSGIWVISGDVRDPNRFFHAGCLLQRMWLEAENQSWHLHPCGALAFLAARVEEGGGESMLAETQIGISSLLGELRNVLDLSSNQQVLFMVRMLKVEGNPQPSKRLPIEAVFQYE